VSEAERWLLSHAGAAPADLLASMKAALSETSGLAVPDALAGAAMRLYARVATGPGGRADALPLLAADALLTHAFEAQAELDPTGVAELARRWGGRMAEVLR
jgi:hypothetical protein